MATEKMSASTARQLNFIFFNGNDLQQASTTEAKAFLCSPSYSPPKDEATMRREAAHRVTVAGGDPTDRPWLLSEMPITFGRYRGQTFSWLLENDVGWTANVVASHQMEERVGQGGSMRATNKDDLLEFCGLYEYMMAAVERRRALASVADRSPHPSTSTSDSDQLVGFGKYALLTRGALYRSRAAEHTSYVAYVMRVRSTHKDSKMQKLQDWVRESRARTVSTSSLPECFLELDPLAAAAEELSDQDLVLHVDSMMATLDQSTTELPITLPGPTSVSTPPRILGPPLRQSTPRGPMASVNEESSSEILLPKSWVDGISTQDHKWISQALFTINAKGKSVLRQALQLWWYPPQPALMYNQPPVSSDAFFRHHFFLWMPYRMWKIRFACQEPGCSQHQLTSCGLYKTVRRVLDVDGFFHMGTEYLECGSCHKKQAAWSHTILEQLDVGHRAQFPALLTYRYTCSNRVLRFLRERGLGNSVGQLEKKIREQHSEDWLHRTAAYLTVCEQFTSSALVRFTPQRPPPFPSLPRAQWLSTVFVRDVFTHMDEYKAKITSTYGDILKMDSTKKITKKLAGLAAGTAAWATNVGNEWGQVLVSVLTTSEGAGLSRMAEGLMDRYSAAHQAPPSIMYVDRDCCSGLTAQLYSRWSDMHVRLDIWHFMRRLASACTTESHQLYSVFMSRLSTCIFEWDSGDLALLREAKLGELRLEHLGDLSEEDVLRRISRKELERHCRRRTRGAEETTRYIQQLIDTLDSDDGCDTMGVRLFDHERIQETWCSQKRHVACIQDVDGFPLYMETGSCTKGGVELKLYRCGRGSTSLESFHRHLVHFIPGTSANDQRFQAYLLQGIIRWNQDRASAALKTKTVGGLRSYSSKLQIAVNQLNTKVFGTVLDANVRHPGTYTGELLGVEYLYDQTGKPLSPVDLDLEVPEEEDEDVDVDEDEDEGFLDVADGTVGSAADEPTRPLPRRHFLRPQSSPVPIMSPRSSTSSISCSARTSGASQSPRKTPSSPSPRKTASPLTPSTSTPPPPTRPDFTSTATSTSTSTATSTSTSTTSAAPPASLDRDAQESVGPDNIPGFDKIQRLAWYLVEIRYHKSLNAAEVGNLERMWSDLHDHDKGRIVYQARHQTKLVVGRFKVSRKTTVTPGVDSVRRCMLGQNTGPANWPSSSRLVEAICTRLVRLHPSKKTVAGTPHWSLVAAEYQNIRQLILSNHRLMAVTQLQLFEVNQRTLTQWYNRTMKQQDKVILTQGLALPCPALTATESLPEPRTLVPVTPRFQVDHHYSMPENTAGTAKHRRPTATVTAPSSDDPAPSSDDPATLAGTASAAIVPRTTLYRRRRREELGQVPVNKRQRANNYCKVCKKPRTKETGHSCQRGHLYCPENAEGHSLKEWYDLLYSTALAHHKKK